MRFNARGDTLQCTVIGLPWFLFAHSPFLSLFGMAAGSFSVKLYNFIAYVLRCKWFEEKKSADDHHLTRGHFNKRHVWNRSEPFLEVASMHPGNVSFWPCIDDPDLLYVIDDDLQWVWFIYNVFWYLINVISSFVSIKSIHKSVHCTQASVHWTSWAMHFMSTK